MFKFEQNSTLFRWFEFCLVITVAFASPIFTALYVLVSGKPMYSGEEINVRIYPFIIFELTGLAVLFYVLTRQERSFKDLGFSFSLKDIPITLLLVFTAYLAFFFCYLIIYYGVIAVTGNSPQPLQTQQTALDVGINIGTIIIVILNPIFEETIARSFIISEIKYLTGSSILAVFLSVAIQTVYHFYQGVTVALSIGAMFLVLSLYYLKFRKIIPVILAHMFFDSLALIVHNK